MASAQWHSRPPYKEAKVAPSGSSTADGPKANKWRVSDKDIPAHVTGAKLSSSEFDAQLSRIRQEDENAPPNLEAMRNRESWSCYEHLYKEAARARPFDV